MDIFLYIMIFISGTVFGSFFSLAVYRIPRKENITYVQSHCTSCNHKLVLKDLIPVFSYVFLKGKCRYCGEKIRNRYVLLEITSGITFLLIALAFNINIFSSLIEFLNLFIIYLFVVALYIVGGINKEMKIIPDSLIIYSIIISCLKIVLNAFCGISVINNLIGFLLIPIVLLILNRIFKNLKIGFENIKYLAVIGLFFGLYGQLIILTITSTLILLNKLLTGIKTITFGYYTSIISIFFLMTENLFFNVFR